MPVDLAQGSGSENADGGDADDKKAVGGGSPNGGGNGDWLTGLSKENQELAKSKGWKTVDDAFKSYTEVQRAFSGRDTKEKQKFRVGDYAFNKPENADALGYSNEFVDAFKDGVSKLGVDPETASGLHDWFVEYSKGALTKAGASQTERLNETFAKAEASLTKAWGPADTPGFKRNLELANRSIRLLDPELKSELSALGAIRKGADGKESVASATIMKVLANVGSKLFHEDNLHGSGVADKNPFADGTEDTAAQGRLIKEDPDKAEAMIRAAGPKMIAMYSHWLNGRKR